MSEELGHSFVSERVLRAREEIELAVARSGRKLVDIEIMAVTKFHPLSAVEAAYAAGIRLFGENRVQEAEEKFPAFLAAHPDASLELIGHLQSNKAKKAESLFRRIQSIDSIEILRELAKRRSARIASREATASLEVLFEFHTGEESKSGFPDLEALLRALEFIGELAAAGHGVAPIKLRGLMTMAPFTKDSELIRASFRALRGAFERIAERMRDADFNVLSMGMTNDYPIAVEEGATLLRIGSAFFGDRFPL